MEAAQTKPIRFNNHLLFWQKSIIKERRKSKEPYYKKYTTTDSTDKASDTEDYEEKIYEEEEETERSNINRNKEKHPVHTARKEKCQLQTQDLLQRILERLERLETQQNKPREKVVKCQPDRS